MPVPRGKQDKKTGLRGAARPDRLNLIGASELPLTSTLVKALLDLPPTAPLY